MEGGSGRPYGRGPVLVGLAIAVLIALGAAIDFRSVVDDVSEVPPPCESVADTSCQEARNAELQARLAEADDAEDDFEARAWLYGFAALAAVIAGSALAFGRTDGASRRELFTDLGVVAVCWLIAGLVLSSSASGDLVGVPEQPIFYPGLALLGVAALGTLLTWGAYRKGAHAPQPSEPRGGRAVRAIGYGATAVAVILSLVVFADRGEPCEEAVSGTVDALVPLAMIAAGIAVLSGFASLIQRRWIGALAMLAVGPFCALIAALTTICLS